MKVRLGDVFKFIDYRGMTPVKTESGVPLITAKNVRQGFLDYKEESFISNEDYKNRQTRGIAHKGDILFTTEAPLGFVALADKDEFSTGQRIITFQQKHDDSNWCNKYFFVLLNVGLVSEATLETSNRRYSKGHKIIKVDRVASSRNFKSMSEGDCRAPGQN